MNPFSAVAEIVVGIYKAGKMQQWFKLIFELLLSGLLSFLFVCGSGLAARAPVAPSIGTGMVAAAVFMTYLFRRSPLTKGMMLVLPEAEAGKEIETNVQIIQK